MMKINHFVDVKLVGFKRNGHGNVFIQEQQLFEFLDLLGQYIHFVVGIIRRSGKATRYVNGKKTRALSLHDNVVYRVTHASEIVNQSITKKIKFYFVFPFILVILYPNQPILPLFFLIIFSTRFLSMISMTLVCPSLSIFSTPN